MLLRKNKTLIYLLPLYAFPALAHNVKTSGNVAATFHIEPNHNPKAGETSQAWFALTKQGGQPIPLEQCNCRLEVHSQPHQENSAPVLEPALKALSVEQYQGVPSAEIVFPKAGIYELELSGTAKDGQSFQPFELSYSVTVQAGSTTQAPASSAISAQPNSEGIAQAPTEIQSSENSWILPAIAIALLLGGGIWFWKRNRKL